MMSMSPQEAFPRLNDPPQTISTFKTKSTTKTEACIQISTFKFTQGIYA